VHRFISHPAWNDFKMTSYIQIALLRAAPRIVVHVVNAGVHMRPAALNGQSDLPDLMPLYLALCKQRISTQQELDAAFGFLVATSYHEPQNPC
jgi:hypothetical protein